MRFPSRFNGTDVNSLSVVVVSVAPDGTFLSKVYPNLKAASENENLDSFVGPFADKHNGALCIRFESKDACDMLSN